MHIPKRSNELRGETNHSDQTGFFWVPIFITMEIAKNPHEIHFEMPIPMKFSWNPMESHGTPGETPRQSFLITRNAVVAACSRGSEWLSALQLIRDFQRERLQVPNGGMVLRMGDE